MIKVGSKSISLIRRESGFIFSMGIFLAGITTSKSSFEIFYVNLKSYLAQEISEIGKSNTLF
jgi:hypothetical protein